VCFALFLLEPTQGVPSPSPPLHPLRSSSPTLTRVNVSRPLPITSALTLVGLSDAPWLNHKVTAGALGPSLVLLNTKKSLPPPPPPPPLGSLPSRQPTVSATTENLAEAPPRSPAPVSTGGRSGVGKSSDGHNEHSLIVLPPETGEQPSLSSGLSDAPWLNRRRPGSLYSIIEYE
jgi:hypothetical protein